jgi:hypothetical protein
MFKRLLSSFLDLVPILLVVVLFQLFVVKQSIPNIGNLIAGMVFIIIGLSLFMQGLEKSLFPLGENMAYAFARKGSLLWLLMFAFCLGFGTTMGGSSLIALSNEAATLAYKSELIVLNPDTLRNYALGFRLTVAFSVGFAIILGVLRILRGWPLYYFIIGGYASLIMITPFAPKDLIGIAYESGGVTFSTSVIPIISTLGVGLASAIRGRNPITDGFGLIAFTSLMPMIFVMAYGILR